MAATTSPVQPPTQRCGPDASRTGRPGAEPVGRCGATRRGHAAYRTVQQTGMLLVVCAVVRELRRPAGQREWHGTLAGFLPYDLRPPTRARFRERMWATADPHLIQPRVFGVGWTVNLGRMVWLLRRWLTGRGWQREQAEG